MLTSDDQSSKELSPKQQARAEMEREKKTARAVVEQEKIGHSLTHSLTRSLTHSLTHSLTLTLGHEILAGLREMKLDEIAR